MHDTFGVHFNKVFCVFCVQLTLAGCAARPAHEEHVVASPMTAEISEGFPPRPQATTMEYACPMDVEGADVVLVPIKGGSAFVFTSALASPVEVRQRTWYFAAAYDSDGSVGPQRTSPSPSPAGFATSAQYSEVVAGARVEIRPLLDRNLEALRAHLRSRLTRMLQTKSC